MLVTNPEPLQWLPGFFFSEFRAVVLKCSSNELGRAARAPAAARMRGTRGSCDPAFQTRL
jgi:hypothetical protein